MKKDDVAIKTKKIMDFIENTMNNVSKFLKRSFKKLKKDFKTVDGDINFEFLFTFFIKVFFLIIGFILLKIPFDIVKDLGTFLFGILFSPLDFIFCFLWRIFISGAYFFTCLYAIYYAFKKYFVIKKKISFLPFLKLLVSVFVLFPAWCLNVTLIFSILLVFYFLIKGITILGLFILLIGCSFLLGHAVDGIKKIFSGKKVSFLPLLISFSIIIIGSLLFIRNVKQYNYHDTLEQSYLKLNSIYEVTVNDLTMFESPNGSKKVIVDNTLEDKQVKVEIIYYNGYNVRKEENRIIFYTEDKRSKKDIFELFLKDLKDKNIYNYGFFNSCDIIIYVNENTRGYVN